VVGADGDGQRPRRDPVEDPEERQAQARSAADRAVGAHLLPERRGGLEPEERRDAEGEHPAHPVDGEQVGAPGLQPRTGFGLRGMGERHDVEQHDHPQLEGEDDGHDRRPEGDAPIADHRHHRPRGERPPPPRAAQLPRERRPEQPVETDLHAVVGQHRHERGRRAHRAAEAGVSSAANVAACGTSRASRV